MLNFSVILGTTIGNSLYYYLSSTKVMILIVILLGLTTIMITIKFIKTLKVMLEKSN